MISHFMLLLPCLSWHDGQDPLTQFLRVSIAAIEHQDQKQLRKVKRVNFASQVIVHH